MKPKRKTRLIRTRGTLTQTDIDRIAALEARLVKAEARIAELESRPTPPERLGPQPGTPNPWKWPRDPYDIGPILCGGTVEISHVHEDAISRSDIRAAAKQGSL